MTGMGDAFGAQLRAAKAEGELARIKDELRGFAEENGLNPEMEPRDLLAKAAGAFRSCAAVSDARYAEIRELRAEMEAMRPRLMPEGMEWPVFEDGDPVRIGDEYADTFGANTVATIEFGDGYSAINPNTPGGYVVGKFEGAHGRYVPRPAPKVLDADGVEIREGDTVWPKYPSADRSEQVERAEVVGIQAEYGRVDVQAVYATGMSFREQIDADQLTHERPVLDADGVPIHEGDTVYALCDGTKHVVERIEGGNIKAEGMTYLVADKITHRAPALAADGRPLREGETVWSVDSGTRYTVEKVTDELIPIKCCSEMGTTVSLHPSQLTHERTDSWERWRREWMLPPCDYCKRVLGIEYDHEMQLDDAFDAQGDDLVRRARAMAGVE